jgi:broad specificity phosphatase PhoE
MELEHKQTTRRIFEASGSVEITSAIPNTRPQRYNREIVRFDFGLMAGETDEERRANFQYYKTIYNDKDERNRMREIERQGRVRLVDYKIKKELGLLNGDN